METKSLFFVHGGAKGNLLDDMALTFPRLREVEPELLGQFMSVGVPPEMGLFPIFHKRTGKELGCLAFLLVEGTLKTLRKSIPLMVEMISAAKRRYGDVHVKTGLGALTAPATAQGLDLIRALSEAGVKDVSVTNGNALTAGVTFHSALDVAKRCNKDIRLSTVAVVGAAGSVGGATAELFARNCGKLILIERSHNIDRLAQNVSSWRSTSTIEIHSEIEEIKKADMVVVTSSAEKAIIQPEHLSQNAIVYEDTMPLNTNIAAVKEQRKDVVIVDGCRLFTPNLRYSMNIGLPDNYAYACFVQTMMESIENDWNDHVGCTNADKAEEMMSRMLNHSDLFQMPTAYFSGGQPLSI